MSTTRLCLVHWNAIEAAPRAAWLQAAGYTVDATPFLPQALHDLGANPPAAVVIDLTRLPSQGRDMALKLRQYKPTRYLPYQRYRCHLVRAAFHCAQTALRP